MPTIRMVDPATVAGRTKEIFDAVLRREAVVFGLAKLGPAQQSRHHTAIVALRRMIGELESRDVGEARSVDSELFASSWAIRTTRDTG